MVTQRLTDFSQIEMLYRKHLKRDFSRDERKPLFIMKNSWEKNEYECYGLFDGDKTAGYAFFVRIGGDCLLDYFAIAEDRRGEGLGSLFLGQLAECMQGVSCVVCEVENPEASENEDDRKRRERRLRFYIRNGFRETPLTSVLYGVDYRILEFPADRVHTCEELRRIYTELYRNSMPAFLFRTKFRVN